MAQQQGRVAAVAALACVQAGLTSVATIIVFGGTNGSRVPVGLAQTAGVALLITGAVWLLRGRSRSVVIAGCALELAICLYYLVGYAWNESGGIGTTDYASGALVGLAVSFAVMPAIGLMLVTSRSAGTPSRHAGGRTAAAVLAFVQAGVTLAITAALMLGLFVTGAVAAQPPETSANTVTPMLATSVSDVASGAGSGELWIVSIAQLIGVGLLVAGGVRLLSGRAGALFPVAAGAQLVLCVYWQLRGTDVPTPLLFVAMPLLALVLSFRAPNTALARSET